jgi:hypothetical protein
MFVKKETLQEVELNRPYSFNHPLNDELFKVKALNHDVFIFLSLVFFTCQRSTL